MLRRLKNQRGFATLIALIMMGMLMLIGVAAISTTDDEVTVAGNELQEMRAFYAAEAGLEAAAAALQQEYDSTGVPPVIMPSGSDSLNHCAVTYSTSNGGPAIQRVLSVGSLAGLHALVKTFNLTSTAESDFDKAKVSLTQSFETALVPIFQFAVFYGNDLEIAPGPDMTLIGRVHSNGNLWVQANSTLRMDSYVTASGEIIHGRKGPGGVGSGDVLIKDADGNYVSMQAGSDWVDHSHADWYDSSISRWDGRVQDQAHGQGELNLPLTNSDNPHAMIERGTGNPDSYEHKADLRIVDGRAYRFMEDNTWQDVTANMVADGVLTYTTNQFWDDREDQWVDCTELDIEAMYDHGYAPRNGVMYFSDSSSSSSEWPALRVKNGAELDDGLAIASENPLYTLGDFNSVDKKPASIMADAVTFLSNNWQSNGYDSLGSWNKSNRPADETTVNASYLTGNVETTDSHYNGGFENLPRFLEVWSGRAFNWSGSAVNLWNSQQANANWHGGYYSPPIRNWTYDTDLDDPNKLPPETPVVRVFQRTGWKQEYVSFD
ncbi:hypothetical protein GF377_05100 [candidate division GN15 bacterium]|nr:hypothetical protein [candidate division GN15 bacterium]